ncbi:hypothetical protein JYG23_09760 [Sedimentibacter sp. zth1]|uniref:hypothetical protein n=1 Tax=Sedimentibacter sp. zth1 TaxID=2816908 RepID=UPI001A933D24|nr:hypothetical protein [Sedimentibacter sp. zth1]QSX04973.1 hypothetical protein JYG23_09760 [Sedimentibacter sp. zth1]
MQLIGKAIRHKSFGNGIVTNMSTNIITICFPQGEKRFLFPDAFSDYLTLKDGTIQREIHNMLIIKKKTEDAKKRVIKEERERIQRIHNLKVIPNSQAVFNIETDQKNSVFSSWKLSIGHYFSGYSKGKPRLPKRLKPNSLCLLTECTKETLEKNRRIIGAFMVKDDFFGELCKN